MAFASLLPRLFPPREREKGESVQSCGASGCESCEKASQSNVQVCGMLCSLAHSPERKRKSGEAPGTDNNPQTPKADPR